MVSTQVSVKKRAGSYEQATVTSMATSKLFCSSEGVVRLWPPSVADWTKWGGASRVHTRQQAGEAGRDAR